MLIAFTYKRVSQVQFLTVCDFCELRTNKLWNGASVDALSV